MNDPDCVIAKPFKIFGIPKVLYLSTWHEPGFPDGQTDAAQVRWTTDLKACDKFTPSLARDVLRHCKQLTNYGMERCLIVHFREMKIEN